MAYLCVERGEGEGCGFIKGKCDGGLPFWVSGLDWRVERIPDSQAEGVLHPRTGCLLQVVDWPAVPDVLLAEGGHLLPVLQPFLPPEHSTTCDNIHLGTRK